MADFYATMKDKLQAKPKPAGPVFENYTPSWSDWLANKAADMFGTSNASKQSITDYMRDKINPLIPVVGQQESIRQAKGKIASGDVQSGVMDLALEAGGPAKAIFIGPMAKSWNKAAAREAVEMARSGKPMSQIWQDTRTSFHKVGESKTSKAGRVKPMQEVSGRGMKISPDITHDLPPMGGRRKAKVEDYIEHPIFQEYPGFEKLPIFDTPGAGVAYMYPGTTGLPGIRGFGFNPDKTTFVQPSDMPEKLLDPLYARMGTGQSNVAKWPMPETIEHEFQHGIARIEDWPSGSQAQDWQSFPWDPRGIEPGSAEEDLYNALTGQFGAERYPGPAGSSGYPGYVRANYGLYESDVDETMARNAGRRVALPANMSQLIDPISTQDLPFKYQMLTDEVLDRNRALVKSLGLGPP